MVEPWASAESLLLDFFEWADSCGEEQYPAGVPGSGSGFTGESLKKLGLVAPVEDWEPPRLDDGRTIDWSRFQDAAMWILLRLFSYAAGGAHDSQVPLFTRLHDAGDASHYSRERASLAHV